MSSDEIAALEGEVKEYNLQLETVQLSLQNDPENNELQSLKQELEEVISLTKSAIAELKPASVPAPAAKSSQPPATEKWSKEKHPAYQAGYRKPEIESEDLIASAQFAVNDTVSARWKSGDGGFYTARITSITGSSSDPVYIVAFKNYGNAETLRSKDIKPLATDPKKRKADGISGSTTPIPPASNPNVISAAANVDPALAQQARREPSKVSDGPIRPAKIPRKVKANKELEAGKNKWQDFAAKGKGGKSGKKDSMFRTGESVNARGNAVLYFCQGSSLTSSQLALPAAGMKCARTQLGRDISTRKEVKMIEGAADFLSIISTFCFERHIVIEANADRTVPRRFYFDMSPQGVASNQEQVSETSIFLFRVCHVSDLRVCFSRIATGPLGCAHLHVIRDRGPPTARDSSDFLDRPVDRRVHLHSNDG